MLIAFIIFVSLFVFIKMIRLTKSCKSDFCKLFYTGKRFNIIKSLTTIVEKKLSKKVQLYQFIDIEVFNRLKLKNVPVYVLEGDILGEAHLKLYQKVFEKIKEEINLVVLNGKLLISNPKINLVSLARKNLSCEELNLLKSLNVNKIGLSEQLKEPEGEPLEMEYTNGIFKRNNLQGKYFISLPEEPFGYFLKYQTNGAVLYNAFKEVVAVFKGKVKIELCYSYLMIVANNENLEIEVKSKKSDIDFLFNIDIEEGNFKERFKKLKIKAKKELNKTIIINNLKLNINLIKINNLNNYFNLINLNNICLSGFIYFIKYILNIKINNNLLICKPCDLITEDFILSYIFEGKRVKVKYKKGESEGLRLIEVAHTLGSENKFEYGF